MGQHELSRHERAVVVEPAAADEERVRAGAAAEPGLRSKKRNGARAGEPPATSAASRPHPEARGDCADLFMVNQRAPRLAPLFDDVAVALPFAAQGGQITDSGFGIGIRGYAGFPRSAEAGACRIAV